MKESVTSIEAQEVVPTIQRLDNDRKDSLLMLYFSQDRMTVIQTESLNLVLLINLNNLNERQKF